jgi:uncharacterized protein YyaL (SSP411 family)
MRKPRFGFVIVVLATLSVLGVVAKFYRSLIPLRNPNELIYESGDFMRQAAYEQLHWYPMGEEALSEARRLDRPLMVVIGTPWSRLGRVTDDTIFTDPDIVAYLQRSFICVRIDGSQQPYWMSMLAPLSRPAMGAVPDFQIWFLDPTGHPFDSVLITSPKDQMDPNSFMSRIIGSSRQYNEIRRNRSGDDLLGRVQKRDILAFDQTSVRAIPDLGSFLLTYASRCHPKYGGFLSRTYLDDDPGYQRLLPFALRFLMLKGQKDAFIHETDRAIRSPLIDWLEGGFYLRSLTSDWMAPTFDKLAVNNAELMQVFAMAAVLYQDPYYERIAKNTFDCLAKELLRDGLVRSCRVGDESLSGRSVHSSFPPRLLRSLLVDNGDYTLYRWAQDQMGLRVETNYRMLPYFPNPAVLDSDPKQCETVLNRLRISSNDRPCDYAGADLAEVNSLVAARMMAVCRIWNDPERMSIALRLFEQCSAFINGSDVVMGLNLTRNPSRYLGNYLAYADAALENYLATGRVESFEKGLSVLIKARRLFRANSPGWWAMTTDDVYLPDCEKLPDIVDSVNESCTARVIRLYTSYGRLLRDYSNRPDLRRTALAFEFTQDAYMAMGRFTDIALDLGPIAAGYFCSSYDVITNLQILTIGPRATELANELYSKAPTGFVAPCVGRVRSDIRARKPGVYFVKGATIEGPVTVQEAVVRLGSTK